MSDQVSVIIGSNIDVAIEEMHFGQTYVACLQIILQPKRPTFFKSNKGFIPEWPISIGWQSSLCLTWT